MTAKCGDEKFTSLKNINGKGWGNKSLRNKGMDCENSYKRSWIVRKVTRGKGYTGTYYGSGSISPHIQTNIIQPFFKGEKTFTTIIINFSRGQRKFQ